MANESAPVLSAERLSAGEQQTKTKTALDYFAGELQGGAPKGS
jgi:hypothetical protein